jgi:hypothetical protein
VTRGRLRAADHEAPFRGVRIRRDSDGTRADDGPYARDRAQYRRVLRLCRAYREVMPPHSFFAARTAAVLLGAHITHGEDLDVAVLAPARAPRRHGIHGIKVAPTLISIRAHEGLPLSSPASTWAMLAAGSTVRELVIVGDAFLRVPRDSRGVPHPHERLATTAQLAAAVAVGRRRGQQRLREALEQVRVGSSSPFESEFRLDAAAAGLPDPALDAEIRDASGRLLGIADAVYPAFRTIVEVEGDHHRTSRAQWNRDIEKYAAYAAEGWEVVRLTASHIRGRDAPAAAMVRTVLMRRGWRPT